jgi:hypothetical protein
MPISMCLLSLSVMSTFHCDPSYKGDPPLIVNCIVLFLLPYDTARIKHISVLLELFARLHLRYSLGDFKFLGLPDQDHDA